MQTPTSPSADSHQGVSDGDVRPFGLGLDLTSAKFSLANARELALYARMAYDEPPTIEDKDTDTQILIRDVGDAILVACRGTTNLRDFITDAEVWRTKTFLGEVHLGFFEAFKGVITRLIANLTLMCAGNPRSIIPLGHSLGGSLAMLIAKALRDAFFNVHSVYTFGCPRVGDKTYQSNYNATLMPRSPFATLGDATFTVINDCDIVPRVPGWLAGFRRPGRDEFISSLASTQIVEDPAFTYRLESDIWSLLNSWRARRNPTFLDELLTDHHVNNYIAALAVIETETA